MLFTQIEFFVFFAAVLATLLVVKNHRIRKRVLLVASYYFYAYWDWRFLSLILISTMVDYLVALGLARTQASRSRKALLIVSLTCNLGLLGFFKYFNFFVASLESLFGSFGLHAGTLHIVLPIGISFYTFQTLSYTIDVYRGRLEPCRNFFDFALFVAFFPQLVAGPIVRASDFLPQLQANPKPGGYDVFLGFRQFTIGLFKKVFIADHIALFVDYVFGNAGAFGAATTWLAVLAYGLQIYCDFSGYSDMAIGAARVMGYHLPTNFRLPYLATSVTDFWHRWHISLSTWLRDYLYIPLGGNRKGRRRTYVNLFVTMVLGGLWHGAAWTFVVWGAIHGLVLMAEKWLRPHLAPMLASESVRGASKVVGWFVTMLVVFTAWVFFRAASFAQAFLMLRQMYGFGSGAAWFEPFTISVLAAMTVISILAAARILNLHRLAYDRFATPVVLFSMWWLVLVFPVEGFKPFVYFQF
jgi:alginate O-acetyltransferase complex protein AlgI